MGCEAGHRQGFSEGEAKGPCAGDEQGFIQGYRHGETVFFTSSAIVESWGLDSDLVNTTGPTTEEYTDCNHGNQLPIDRRMPPNPAASPLDAEQLGEISPHTETDISFEEQIDAITDLQPEKADDLVIDLSMSPNPAPSSVDAEKLDEISSETETLPSSLSQIDPIADLESEKADDLGIDQSQGQDEGEIASFPSQTFTLTSTNLNSAFFSGQSVVKDFFAPNAAAGTAIDILSDLNILLPRSLRLPLLPQKPRLRYRLDCNPNPQLALDCTLLPHCNLKRFQ